jgi:methionyl-tRNA formyltransferase
MRPTEAPAILMLGMRCRFSATLLRSLLDRGIVPAAILLAADPGEPPGDLALERRFARPGTIEAIARAHRLLVRVVDESSLTAALLRSAADIIAVACFPWRLPDALLQSTRLGALNVHPSLLPRHRGPAPLFWTFRHGDEQMGVTVHEMTRRFDAGPIVEQSALAMPFGIEGADLETGLAELGGSLLARAIERRTRGDLAACKQDERLATTEGFPNPVDLEVRADQSGRFAYAFTRGVASLGFTPIIRVDSVNERFFVASATFWKPGARQKELIIRKNDSLSIQFVDGICDFPVSDVRKTLTLTIDNAARPVR